MAAYKFDNRNYDKTLIVDKDGKLINQTNTPASTLDTDYLYRLITFTADGWIVTHGKAYNGTGVADKLHFSSDKLGSLLYLDSNGDSVLLTPSSGDTDNGKVLKYNSKSKTPYWAADTDTTYKLAINSDTANYGDTTNGVSLGTIYAPTSSGTGIPSLSNTTWSWNTIVDTIGDSSAGIPTVNALKNYVGTATAGLTGAMHYIGDVSKNPTEEAPTEAETPTGGFLNGDVVTYGNKEFVKSTSGWRELGDEGSYALKTISISAGTGLTGGGTLESSRTLSLATITKNNTTPDGGALSYGGSLNVVTGVTYDEYGRVTGVATTKYTLPSTDEIDYSSVLYWASNTTKATANPNSATSNPYLLLVQNDVLKTHVLFNSGTGISISANGEILTITNTGVTAASATYAPATATSYDYTIGTLTYNGSTVTFKGHDTNTWRPVNAYVLASLNASTTTASSIRESSTGTNALCFGSEFVSIEADSNDNMPGSEIHLCWAEVDSEGHLTYAI